MIEEHRPDEERAFGISPDEVRHEPSASSQRLHLYVTLLLVAPFAILLCSALWLRSDDFRNHTDLSYVHQLGYGHSLRHADCQVVIYGDSTALVSIEPSVITARTGMSACNIAELGGVHRLNGDDALDDYLRNNPPPKYLVYYVAPDNFSDRRVYGEVSTTEAFIYALRFMPFSHTLDLFWHHPAGVTGDLENGLQTGFRARLKKRPASVLWNSRTDHRGRLLDPSPSMTACSTMDRFAPNLAWMQALRRQYGINGTRILLVAAPMPACDPSYDWYANAFPSGSLDAPMGSLPLEMLSSSGHLHVTDAGVMPASERVAAILHAQQQADASR
jgi:hypothetical protein